MSSRTEHLSIEPLLWRLLPASNDEDIPSIEQHPGAGVFDAQSNITLRLDNTTYLISSRMQDTYLRRLTDHISRYSNLEMLTLSFGESYFLYNYAEILLKIPAALSRLHLPKLWCLELAHVFTTEQSMIDLLEHHHKTLRVLKLNSIGVGLPRNTAKKESVLSLVWKIRQTNFLQKVTLHGVFTNMVDEPCKTQPVQEIKKRGYPFSNPRDVYGHKISGRTYRTQLEEFMCRRIGWPIGESLEACLLRKEEHAVATSRVVDEDAIEWPWQDGSWHWSTDLLEQCRGASSLLRVEMH